MVIRRVGSANRRPRHLRHYEELPYDDKERLKVLPHQAYWSERHRSFLIELKQSERGNDYSCNKAAIDNLYDLWEEQEDADEDEYFSVTFMQINRKGEEVAWEYVGTLHDLIRGHDPRDGEWGEYFFLKERTFTVVDKPGRRRGARRGFFAGTLPV